MAMLDRAFEYRRSGQAPFAANLNRPQSERARSKLSKPEAQVLQALIAGQPNSKIASQTDGGAFAVREHIKSMLRKVRGD